MIGKRVQFDDETWATINLLREERRRGFQQLADEAFRDLLGPSHCAPPNILRSEYQRRVLLMTPGYGAYG